MCLRVGVDPLDVTRHLAYIQGTPVWHEGVEVTSIPNAISKAFNAHVEGDTHD